MTASTIDSADPGPKDTCCGAGLPESPAVPVVSEIVWDAACTCGQHGRGDVLVFVCDLHIIARNGASPLAPDLDGMITITLLQWPSRPPELPDQVPKSPLVSC